MGNYTTREAAPKIGKSVSWLNKSRMNGTGPKYLKIGGGVIYTDEHLVEFKRQCTRTAVYDFANDNSPHSARAA
ncbi:MAG: hypothetical protein MnENMB40S_37270 [Rhizobiaceae bacterium MnEN-MB40S]|nr:MAG: hypothetical protein MnENMB40S_37270 [Rhizobiaceae bacterium MnEN-MB40S]